MNAIERELREALMEQYRKVYSPRVIELFENPVNRGVIPEPNGFGIIRGICGDTMKIYLRIVTGRVKDAGFETDGCEATIAVGSAVTELARSMTIMDVLALSPARLIEYLGGLPPDHIHCSILAVNTLHNAVANYLLLAGSSARREGRDEKNETAGRDYRSFPGNGRPQLADRCLGVRLPGDQRRPDRDRTGSG